MDNGEPGIEFTDRGLELLASSVYAAWTACLSPSAINKHRSEWLRRISPGDLVMETSLIHRREQDRSRFGWLVSVTDEPYLTEEEWQVEREHYPPEHQDQPPTNRIWTIKSMVDGSLIRWENCEFIRVPSPLTAEERANRDGFWGCV